MDSRQIEKALKEVLHSLHAKSASIDSANVSDALLSYAEEHDLAPTQLQKLAQAYNHARALAQAKHATTDQKGANLDVIDSNALAMRYIQPTEKKAAFVRAAPSEWHAFSAGRKFGGAPSVNLKEVDDWFDKNKDKVGGFQKVAADAEPSANTLLVEARELERLATDASVKAARCLDKVLGKVRMNRKIAATVVRDIDTLLGADGPAVSLAFESMLKTAGMHPGRVDMAEEDFCEDTHKIEKDVKEASEHLEFAQTARAMAGELKEAANARNLLRTPQKAEDRAEAEEEVRAQAYADTNPKPNDPKANAAAAAKAQKEDEARGGDDPPPPKDKGKEDKPRPYVPAPASDFILMTPPAPKREKAPGTLLEALTALGEGATAGLALPGQMVDDFGNAARKADPAGSAASAVSAYTTLFGAGRELASKKLTSRLEQIRQQATLQRLLLSDPIIRKQDPAEVTRIFNTVRTLNPTAASDVNIARLVLREALQHQGMPLQMMKSLKDLK